MTERVDDPDDPRLEAYRSLKDPARARREEAEGVFVAEGRLAVAALCDSPCELVSLLLDERRAGAAEGLVQAASAAGAPVYLAPPEVVAATTGFALHRGIVAVGRRPARVAPADLLATVRSEATREGRRCVVLVGEGLNDHENLGALFRNAAAFGVGGVLLDPRSADPLYRRCVRVSVGHVLKVPFARLAPWPAALGELSGAGFHLAALTPRGVDGHPAMPLGRFAAAAADLAAVALLVGAEGAGLSAEARAAAGTTVAIPMASGVDSLNVATAAAIACYALEAAWTAPPEGSG